MQERPQQFSALTASTQLKRVVVLDVRIRQVLPLGAVQHMFSPGRQLQALTCLELESSGAAYAGIDLGQSVFISAADMKCLVRACSSLQHLAVCNALEDGAAVQELLQLPPCCSSLSVGGEAFHDAAASVVAQLTQLTALTWSESAGLTDLGLERLTTLKDLQELGLFSAASITQEMFPRREPLHNVGLSSGNSQSQQVSEPASVLCGCKCAATRYAASYDCLTRVAYM